MQIPRLLLCLVLSAPFMQTVQAEDLGNLSANPFLFDSTANPFGQGSAFAQNGVNNPFSLYGSPFSNQSATNPFATDAPKLYDQQGNYRGKLSDNPLRSGFDQQPIRALWLAVFSRLAEQFLWRREPLSL